jgi:hypothetical protein
MNPPLRRMTRKFARKPVKIGQKLDFLMFRIAKIRSKPCEQMSKTDARASETVSLAG